MSQSSPKSFTLCVSVKIEHDLIGQTIRNFHPKEQNHTLGLTGNLPKLGGWNPFDGLPCKLIESQSDYSCFENVLFLENGLFVQPGWLLSRSEIQIRIETKNIKFYSSKFIEKKLSSGTLYFSCSHYDCTQYGDENDNDTHIASTNSIHTRPVYTSSLDQYPSIHEKRLKIDGLTEFKQNEIISFHIQTWDIEHTAADVKLYFKPHELTMDYKVDPTMPLELIGCARFGPFDVNHGRKVAQLLNFNLKTIGNLRIEFTVIHPLVDHPTSSLEVSYRHHWKKRRAFDIGHRGMGQSFKHAGGSNSQKKPANNKENTLDSFRKAVQHGADFVEMDVQLTKDRKVVVYHDYEAVVISRKKRDGKLSYLPISVCDLNYADLRELKIHHSSVLEEEHTHEKMNEDDLDPIDMQSFPLLRSCLDEIDSDVGFVIEVKYPMAYKAGGHEMPNFFERNLYVDTILREVLNFSGYRRIILSCFDPSVCAMLQLKQHIYPVFQLGIAPEYLDSRQSNFELLFCSAISHQLLGVCLDSDHLLTRPEVVQLAHKHCLVVLAWGEAVNREQDRLRLIETGIDGIIFDKLQETKEAGSLNLFKQERMLNSSQTSSNESLQQSIVSPLLEIKLTSTSTINTPPNSSCSVTVDGSYTNDLTDKK